MPNPQDRTSLMTPRETLSRPSGVAIKILDGPRAGETVAVDKAHVICGRQHGVDLAIRERSISKVHFELRATQTGVEIRDLNSRNGLWFERRRLYHGALVPGDRFQAGECNLELVAVTHADVEVTKATRCGDMIGHSPIMRALFAHIERLAQTTLDVLIQGETGTGKELAARAIHTLSRTGGSEGRGPFVVLDCASLASSLSNGTLFGFRKGAFTGATHDQAGVFELADGGAIFLDEIGELPLEEQQKLLRVLDQRSVCRLGEPGKERALVFRVIAATNRDLEREVAEGRFREDLFYRLSEEVTTLPPLRERGEDVLALARHFAERQGATLDEGAEIAISLRDWPGNVRELRSAVKRAAAMSNGPTIHAGAMASRRDPSASKLSGLLSEPRSYSEVHAAVDRVLLPKVVREMKGNLTASASRLGMSRETLRNKLRGLGLYAE